MRNVLSRRIGAVAVFVGVGLVAACGGKVDQEDFDAQVADLQSTIDEHDQRISDNSSRIDDLDSRVGQLERDLEDLRQNFQARIEELEQGMRFALPVHFEFDRAQIRSVDRPVLDRFASVIQNHYSDALVTVEGFADPAGSQQYNIGLSQDRAQNVMEYLVDQGGLSENMIKTVGYGEVQNRLVRPGEQGPGREGLENRRVTFVVEFGGSLDG